MPRKHEGIPKTTKSPEQLNAQYRKSINASIKRIRVSSSRLEKKLKSRKYHLQDGEKLAVLDAVKKAVLPLMDLLEEKPTESDDVLQM